jgi:hypothetical protein
MLAHSIWKKRRRPISILLQKSGHRRKKWGQDGRFPVSHVFRFPLAGGLPLGTKRGAAPFVIF